MRALSDDELSDIASPILPLVVLVEMELASVIRLCTASIDLDLSGTIYYGTRGLGRIGELADSPADPRPIGFEISGVPSANIAMALSEPVRGRAILVKTLLLNPATYAPRTPRLRWQGRGDVMMVREQGGTASIQVQAEHCAADLLRGTPSYWTDAEQRRLFPGDAGCQHMASQTEKRLVWPSAEYFKQ